MSFPPLLAQRRPSPPGDSRVRSLCGSCTKSSIITQSNWVTTLSLGCALQCRGGPDGGRRVRRTLGVCLLICVRACSHLKTSLCEREREGERERREGGRQRERRGGGREREKIQPLRKRKKRERASDQFQVSFLSNYRHQNRKLRSLPSGPVLPMLVSLATQPNRQHISVQLLRLGMLTFLKHLILTNTTE